MTKILNFGRSFLLWHAHDHVHFRLQEFYAITKMLNINFEWIEEPSLNEVNACEKGYVPETTFRKKED